MYKTAGRSVALQGYLNQQVVRTASIPALSRRPFVVCLYFRRRDNQGNVRIFRNASRQAGTMEALSAFVRAKVERGTMLFGAVLRDGVVLCQHGDEAVEHEWETTRPRTVPEPRW